MRPKLHFWVGLLPSILALSLACDENYDLGDQNNNGNHTVYYGVEAEPSLSPDHQWVFYVVTDTVTPANSGIYRASAATAVREQVLSVAGAHSPVVLPDNETLLFAQNNRVKQHPIGSNYTLQIGTLSVSAVAAVTNVQFVAQNGENLVKLAANGEPSPFTTGQYPSGIAVDSIVYLYHPAGGSYSVWRAKPATIETAKIADLPGGLAAQWPMIRPNSSQIVFTVPLNSSYRVLRYNTSTTKTDTLGISRSAKPCFLDDGSVLFTGDDGRLWVLRPFGGPASPWVAVEG